MADTKRIAMFTAGGQNGLRIMSVDGRNWINPSEGKEGEIYRAGAFGNGRHVAVGTFGGKNIMAGTVDGKTWETTSKDGQYKLFIRGLTFGAGQFVAVGGEPVTVGSSSPFVLTSADGVKWSEYINIAGKNILRRIAFGNDIFVGVGDRGRRSFSKDIKTWQDAPGTRPIDTLIDITFGNGLFAGVGLHGLRMTTADGVKWSEKMMGEEGAHLNTIVFADDQFVAVGEGATYFSADGVKWKSAANKNAPQMMAHGAGAFVGLNWKGRILYSKDAITWEDVHKAAHHLEAICFG